MLTLTTKTLAPSPVISTTAVTATVGAGANTVTPSTFIKRKRHIDAATTTTGATVNNDDIVKKVNCNSSETARQFEFKEKRNKLNNYKVLTEKEASSTAVIGGNTLNERLYNVCRSIAPMDTRFVSLNDIVTDDTARQMMQNGKCIIDRTLNFSCKNFCIAVKAKDKKMQHLKSIKDESIECNSSNPCDCSFVVHLNDLLTDRMRREKVTLGGPSAVGKSTLLDIINNTCSFADVSRVSFEEIYHAYNCDHEATGLYLLTKRIDKKLYEHTNECVLIYPIIHHYMKMEKSAETARRCYVECVKTLVDVSHTRMLILLDFTPKFRARYFKRLEARDNQIDYNDDWYLYLQLAAFLAILTNNHLFPALRVIVRVDGPLDKMKTSLTLDDEEYTKLFHSVLNNVTIPRVDSLMPLETLPKTFMYVSEESFLDDPRAIVNLLLQMHIVDERGAC